MSGIQKGEMMNEINIRKYAGLMAELGLTGLEITDDNKKVRLERSAGDPASVQPAQNVQTMPPQEEAYGDIHRTEEKIVSPMVGVFYSAAAENAENFVAVGDRVEKGQVLCIIEAMKLMNEICAEESGVISEICASNGQIVEYGTELFRIRR